MTLQYDAQPNFFPTNTMPIDVAIRVHRGTGSYVLSLSCTMAFDNQYDQTDADFLGWIEDVKDALITAGWVLDGIDQRGPNKASRQISTV